jgi:hypothetical protein
VVTLCAETAGECDCPHLLSLSDIEVAGTITYFVSAKCATQGHPWEG